MCDGLASRCSVFVASEGLGTGGTALVGVSLFPCGKAFETTRE